MDASLKEALRSYGGPLSTEQIQVLRDMQGWIEYCISNGLSMKSTLGVLAQDSNGILSETPYFTPKTTGYRKYRTEVEDLSGLADEPNPNEK